MLSAPGSYEKLNVPSQDLAQKIGEAVFPTKTGFGIPKVILVEDDFDFTDVSQVVWAFASRAHPHHGEIYFEGLPQNNLLVLLDPNLKFTYHASKVVHNCLLADRFPRTERPVAADLAHGWPVALQQHVLKNWNSYGYR